MMLRVPPRPYGCQEESGHGPHGRKGGGGVFYGSRIAGCSRMANFRRDRRLLSFGKFVANLRREHRVLLFIVARNFFKVDREHKNRVA